MWKQMAQVLLSGMFFVCSLVGSIKAMPAATPVPTQAVIHNPSTRGPIIVQKDLRTNLADYANDQVPLYQMFFDRFRHHKHVGDRSLLFL
jgi:hypothetical protein